ncbi:MAG TPA: VWA domain-containing protein [Candidatus Sulfotelmatobacter sp.]
MVCLFLECGNAFPQTTTLRSQSNVVLVPALVKDADGAAVYGLQAKDFVIEDDGAAQSVHLDEEAEGQPISIVVAVQRGRRANYEFPRIRGLSSMLGPLIDQGQTRIALLEFDSSVQTVREFTKDAALINADLESLEPGDGGAAILDAVFFAQTMLAKEPEGRKKVLLLISETRDHGSALGKQADDIIAALGKSNTIVYALAFSPSISNILDTGRGNNKNEMNAGPDLLAPLMMARQAMRKNIPKTVAEMTGGEYELFSTRKKFDVRVNDFTNHLHSRYLLSFEPKNPHPGLHRISVRLVAGKGQTVLARTTYWAKGATE